MSCLIRWRQWLSTVSSWLVWLVVSSWTQLRVTRVTIWTSTCLCSPCCSFSSTSVGWRWRLFAWSHPSETFPPLSCVIEVFVLLVLSGGGAAHQSFWWRRRWLWNQLACWSQFTGLDLKHRLYTKMDDTVVFQKWSQSVPPGGWSQSRP